MKNNRVYDVIIIGAGVVGASIALALSRQGLKTLNVDALPAAGYGSTSNSSAIIRPFYSAVENCALAHEARNRWTSWQDFLGAEDENGYADYTECGMLILLAAGDEQNYRASLHAMQTVGVNFELLPATTAAKMLSGFDMRSFGPPKLCDNPLFGIANETALTGAIFIPQAGYVSDPQLATHNLQRAAEALGAHYQFNTNVVAVNQSGGHVTGISTHRGEEIEAAIIINAAGPHSAKINAIAGVEEDMAFQPRPERHEVAHVPMPDQSGAGRFNCVIGDGDTGVYMRPEVGNNMLIGSMDPACDARVSADADHYNDALTEQWTNQVWRAAQRIPSLKIPNTASGVVGLYDTTPDWVPIYDKSSLSGYYMAVGTSGNQFKCAPVIGDIMATLISVCEDGQDHDKHPVTMGLPALGRNINLGFYSRKRTPHTEGSGTVLA